MTKKKLKCHFLLIEVLQDFYSKACKTLKHLYRVDQIGDKCV